ncbi:hypothetical protein EB151_12785, partial [archaeon]|nr:hypothetical protein [archaeon]
YSNGVDGYSDKQNISFNYKHSGNTNFSFSRNGDVNSDQSQIRIGSINDVYSIGTSLSILKFGFTNTVTDQATANNKRVFTTSDIYTAKLPAKGNMPSVELEKVNSEADDNVNIATTVAEKVKVTNKFGSTNISLISGQSTTNSINSMDDKSTLGVSLSANKNFNLIAEQQDQTIQSGLSTRSLSGQKFGLNLTPMPNTILSTFITENSDGANKTETYEYKAVAGSDKTLFKLDGVYKIRNATDLNPSLNNDSTNTSVSIKPLKNIILSGNYLLNPDDPTKPNILVPIERRQYSLAHKSGSLELIGSYSDTEYLKGTAADVLAKSNGNSFFGETSFKMNYRSGSSTIFNTEYKEQFSRSTNYRTNGIFSFGMNHSKASTVFSLTGTIANNYSNNWNRDYKAEAKLNYKF